MSYETERAARCDAEHCITCSDEGVPMRVESVDESIDIARCIDESGTVNEVLIALVPHVSVGDILLVHAATALTRLETNGRQGA